MTDNHGGGRIATEEDSDRSTRAVVVPGSRTNNNVSSYSNIVVTRSTTNPFFNSLLERDTYNESRISTTMNNNENTVAHSSNCNSNNNGNNSNSNNNVNNHHHWSLMLPPYHPSNNTFIQMNYSLCREHNWRLTLNNYQNCNALRDMIIDYAKYPCICNISKNPHCSWNVYPVANIVNKIKEKNTECLLLLRQLLDFYESIDDSSIRQQASFTTGRSNPFLQGFMDHESIDTSENNNTIVSSTAAETSSFFDILRNPLPLPPFLYPDVVSDQSIKRPPIAHSYVYAVFRIEDLSLMRLHNGPWRKSSTNMEMETSPSSASNTETSTVTSIASASTAASIVTPGTSSNGNNSSNTAIVLEQYLSCCCHCTKYKKHVILGGWYVARRLKSGFSQCLREKQKQKKSLTFLKSFEYNGGMISLTNVLCTCLKVDFPKFCFNVQGNILYASTVDIRNLSEDNLPNDEHVLRLVERILEDNSTYQAAVMNSRAKNVNHGRNMVDSFDDTVNNLNDTQPHHHHHYHHYHSNYHHHLEPEVNVTNV